MTLERKKKICKGCGQPRFIWARGYCKPCDPGKQKKQEDKEQELADQKELDAFYQDAAKLLPNHCQNCGEPLRAFTPALQRCVTAHILPKSKFESVKTHLSNFMALGVTCGCHSKWDNLDAKTRLEMNCYDIAIEKYQIFEHELTPKELNHAEKYLGINQ